MTYKPTPTVVDGGQVQALASDDESQSLLVELLAEIRGLREDMAQRDGVSIVDGCGTLRRATVSETGALSVGPIRYDETSNNTMAVDNQVYNFYSPSSFEQFVITGILAFASKDVNNASDTIIEVYEADSSSSATVDKALLTFGMGSLTNLTLTPLNLLVTEGTYINARTDDNTVNMTIMGYFISLPFS